MGAIAFGAKIVNHLSSQDGHLSKDDLTRLDTLFDELVSEQSKKILRDIPFDRLLDLLRSDKKTMGDTVYFVMLKKIGEIEIYGKRVDVGLSDSINDLFKTII